MDVDLESRRELMHAKEALALLYDAHSHLKAALATLDEKDYDFRVRMELVKSFQHCIDSLQKADVHLMTSRQVAPGVEAMSKAIYARAHYMRPRVFKLIEKSVISGLGHQANHDTLITLIKEEYQLIQKQMNKVADDQTLVKRAVYRFDLSRSLMRLHSYIRDVNSQLIAPLPKLFETAHSLGLALPQIPQIQEPEAVQPAPKDDLPYFPTEEPPAERNSFVKKLFS